jgi:hypothetical protein
VISEKKIKFSSNLQDEAAGEVSDPKHPSWRDHTITEHRHQLECVWRFISLQPCIGPGPKCNHNVRSIILLTTLHVDVWSFLVKGAAFLRSPSLRMLFPNVIWVSHSPRILLSVTLRLLWVSHTPTILLGVSFRSLSSRPLRGFI